MVVDIKKDNDYIFAKHKSYTDIHVHATFKTWCGMNLFYSEGFVPRILCQQYQLGIGRLLFLLGKL